jgi:hypothetical protein
MVSHEVSKGFPSGSQNIHRVPNVFPQYVPNSTQLYLILFGHISTSMYISGKGRGGEGCKGSMIMLVFWGE